MVQVVLGFILSVMLSIVSCYRDFMPGPSEVSWQDSSGDVVAYEGQPDRPVLDLVRVSVRSGDGTLSLRTEIQGSVDEFLSYADADGQRYGDVMVEFFIDSDNDPSTGGSPMWYSGGVRPLIGYDFSAYVMLGTNYLSSAEGLQGMMLQYAVLDDTRTEDTGPLATYSLWRMKGEFGRDRVGRGLAFEEYTVMDGNAVEIRIPYSLLEAEASDTIRICFKEVAEGPTSVKGVSKDRYMKLK